MATGTVTTARGMALNIDELIMNANRPIDASDTASTRETGHYKTPVLNQPKVRGFVPVAGDAVLNTTEEGEEETEVKTSSRKKPTTRKRSQKSLAEMTQVTVKETEDQKKTRAAKKAESEPEMDEDETLGDIISEMDD